jgi:hypothetical protein
MRRIGVEGSVETILCLYVQGAEGPRGKKKRMVQKNIEYRIMNVGAQDSVPS